MGVDASYVYGYMAELDEIEWDIEFLRSKYDASKKVNKYYEHTYGDLIDWIERGEVEDLDEYEALGFKYEYPYDDQYLYFTHQDLAEEFPDRKLSEMDNLAKEYAKQRGVKNYEIFTWDEFGYFD